MQDFITIKRFQRQLADFTSPEQIPAAGCIPEDTLIYRGLPAGYALSAKAESSETAQDDPMTKRMAMGLFAGAVAFIGIVAWWVGNSTVPNDSTVINFNTPNAPIVTTNTAPANLPGSGQK